MILFRSMSGEKEGSAVHLWLILWRAFKAMEAHDLRSIASLDLGGHSDFAVLEVLLHKGPLPVNEIGRKVFLTSGSITTAVSRAEKKGYVRRLPSAVDGRVVEVHLTEEGRKVITAAFAVHAENLERAASALNGNERRELTGLLKKLGLHAQRQPTV